VAIGRFAIGQSVPRKEDARFLKGAGCFVEDIRLPRMAYAVVVRSPHAHATIRGIDTAEAAAMPGVLAVLTGADVAADGLGGIPCIPVPGLVVEDAYFTSRPILAGDRARFVGDAVALVVAETLAAAKDAAEAVAVDYDVLPAVAGIADALAAGATAVWDPAPANVAFALSRGDAARAAAALAGAHHVTRLEIASNRVSANAMENRGALADYHSGDDRFTLYTSTQAPHRMRPLIAQFVLHIPETRLRVVARDVGGGFGMKGNLYPEEILVVWAAGKLGRPVRWIAERSEALLTDAQGRDHAATVEMGFDRDGRIVGMRADLRFNLGAYMSVSALYPSMLGAELLPNVYDIPALHIRSRGVFSNTAPTAPYRGAGVPEAVYTMERLIDEAALQLGIDPVELRRRNAIAPAAMPHTTGAGLTYDSGEFAALMDDTLALADRDGFAARRAQSEARGRRRGIGVCSYVEMAAFFNDRMEIRFDASGDAAVIAGTFSHGQGHETAYAQMVSDWLGVPFERVRFIQGDTDQVSFGRGTFGSRSLTVGGGALRGAADVVIARGKELAAHVLEAAVADIEFAEGRFRVAGTDRAVDFPALARASFMPTLPRALGLGIEGIGIYGADAPNFPNGCHVCEVEVDPETGTVEVARYSVVDDVGVAINPLLLHGQIHGGVVQGIGQALMEAVVVERDTGQVLSGSFMDYCMPRADDVPSFAVGTHDVPCRTNVLGVKGAGEAGCVGAPPAVVNAILDALRPLGVATIEMPATPERVWRAVRDARGG